MIKSLSRMQCIIFTCASMLPPMQARAQHQAEKVERPKAVGLPPTEEMVKLFRDLFTLKKATTDFEEFQDTIQSARERLDEAWEKRYMSLDE